jgi:hypothetical protein
MAKHIGVSHSSVGRIWRAFGLAPHKSETFTLSNDPLFVDKVRDIVGLTFLVARHDLIRGIFPRVRQRRSLGPRTSYNMSRQDGPLGRRVLPDVSGLAVVVRLPLGTLNPARDPMLLRDRSWPGGPTP